MQVRFEDVSPVEKKMFVEIPWDTVSAKLGEAYRDLGRGVALKGFRKGKVPRPVLEQVYGARIHYEVAVGLVRESFFRATTEHKIAAVAEPRVDSGAEIKKGQPFAFSAIVEVRGEVEPKDYRSLPIERRRLKVGDDAVEAALKQLQREHTELVPLEGRDVTAASDVIAVNLTGTIGEHAINQPRFVIDLDPAEKEPLPGLRAALTGIPVGSKELAIKLDVPADFEDENLRGRPATLVATVLEARAKDVPALDDEFAKDTGKGEDLAGLRAAVRKDLEERETQQIQRECREQALRELVKRNQVPVAASLVERAIEVQYNRLRSMLGMKPEKNDPGPNDELRAKMRPGAADEVRGQLVLEAVGEREKVELPDAELDAHIAEVARSRNTTPQRVRAEWAKDGRLDNTAFQLRQSKVLDFLVGAAAVTEVDALTKPVTGDGGTGEPLAMAHGEAGHVHGPDCDH
ncbi:MAG: trigger factor [Kofleriaceae bacterium]|jgi:trigger factor|nr:trigger factor [Kofleriaceae bacterium]MBP6838314.1 trigger factor [Kofleriaceae bacterium]MBP9203972.1 trigger factor [Kofleriaceae bacterium]